jgi:outer membrane protein assembly factor BamD (BamD/ComL family)
MKKAFLIFSFIFFVFTFSAFAQDGTGDKPQLTIEQILELDAKANLDVAKQYFKLKKAYKAVLSRFEETFAAHPGFSEMDEFLYMAGMSSFYLSENKGKQKVNLKIEEEREKYNPEKLREDAVAYFSFIIENFPESKYRDDAEKMLEKLKGNEK